MRPSNAWVPLALQPHLRCSLLNRQKIPVAFGLVDKCFFDLGEEVWEPHVIHSSSLSEDIEQPLFDYII